MPVFNPFQPWTYQPPKPSGKKSIEGPHPPIIGKPVMGPPLSESVIEEVLRQYREAMRHGELPIAFGPGGLVTVPKPTPTAPRQTPTPQPPTPPTPPSPPSPPTRVAPPIETEAQAPTPPTPRTATPTTPATAQPTPPPFVIETELGLTPPPTIPNIPPHILLNLPELELPLTPEEFARLFRRPRLAVPA
jgi:hypothetical protein